MKIKDIIKEKGPTVYSIDPDRSVKEAIEFLVQHGIGSLLVVEDARPIGIFTERDSLRICHLEPEHLADITVRSRMSSHLIIGQLEDDVESIMCVMTEKRIRHLPVIEDSGAVAGMISIGDIVKSLHDHHESEVRYLKDYITGNDMK